MAVVVTVAKGFDLGYIWKTQGETAAGHVTGGYYINAAQAGEPPGRWWGPGARALGFNPGQLVERPSYEAVYRQVDPRTGATLGRRRGRYPMFADHLARLKAAEPHATAERLIELEREAAQATRHPAAYTDVTVSFSKSISVLHASIRENERRARQSGDDRAAAYWGVREQRFQDILQRANRAALQYAQDWAGVTRTGSHGTRVDGRELGRFEPAGLIVTSWLQGTSRDGDPQDHIHNQIARITRTLSDGKWRALDTVSLRAVLGALQAVAAMSVECELTAEFGVEWIPRADGRGNEIRGVTRAQMDAYSTRTVQVHEKERELARAWEHRHGRAPTSRELLHIASDATLLSRQGKDAEPVDWHALAARWDATLGGELAGIAPSVSNARGPDADTQPHAGGSEPGAPPSREAQARALAKALILVSDRHPAWTRHDLLKHLALVMPPQTRQMGSEEAQELLLGLADEALSGRTGEVVSIEAPEWPPLPASLRRELDGRSIYTRPGTARYATTAQLSLEDKLLAHAQTQSAPRLSADRAARRLGADPALLDAQLRGRARNPREHDAPRGLRLDQAATVWQVLTSPRTVEIITGPAGTGKTRVLATAARIWDGPVFGTATSQNATNGLRQAGVPVAVNTTRLFADLAEGRIPPGALIVADEGSMISMTHLAALADYAARNGCKLVLAGDQEQLAAVEGGGAMTLLADRLGYVQLAEPMRFAAEWERAASLRLRQGDATALAEYDQHGRIRGAPPEQAMDQAAYAFVASYLAGRDVLLMAADWARCRELSARIREDLIHLGLVEATRSIRIADGAEASAGDLIICRSNDHAIEAGEPGRALANGDILRIEAVAGQGIMVRRLLEPDRANGQRRFTDRAFRFPGYRSAELAYALTGHSAQGGTVHTGIALVTGSEDRQWLYPAMTRGTDANLAFVFTTPARPADPQPGTRPAPGLGRYDRLRRERAGHHPGQLRPGSPGGADPRQPAAVLADILGRDGAGLSATAVWQRNLANADHLAALHAIWTAETKGARHDRYREIYGYDHPDDPIGPEPARDAPDQRAVWYEAFAALGPAGQPDVRAMSDGRLWLLRDVYAAETAWAPRHVGKELRLSRLGAFDAGLGAIRADAETAAARKAGDRDRAGRHETLAGSYRALRDIYQQREQALAQATADRQEWERATEQSRRLAITADAELRRRHPGQKIEPLRSAEPVLASDTGREQPDPALGGKLTEMALGIGDLAAQHQAFRAEMNEHRQLLMPGDDPAWGDLGNAFPDWPASDQDAILKPPKPEIIPAARILQLTAEHDTEPDHEAAD